ncbi:MAG TPA: hypothetical protein VG204_21945 [Terriglobia bacterium]|nr:hypothetical protein [Terriglobia bacterium]
MHGLSNGDEIDNRGAGGDGALAKRITPVAAARLASAADLMGTGDQLSIPRLEGIPQEYLYSAGDSALIVLARTLVEVSQAAPEDWESAHRDPGAYVLRTVERWIAAHGGAAIRRRFDVYATLGSDLNEYSGKNEENPDGTQLYLTVDPDRCGFVVLGPTLESLEKAHPRLPATFYSLFMRALNHWVRVYDYKDAEDRVTMLKDWIEGEADEDQYEIPDVEGCIPAYIKGKALGRRKLREVRAELGNTQVGLLVDALLDLADISGQAKRPELTDRMREEFCDTNPPLPSLLAVFTEGDAVEGCFDDEGQTMMEVTPEPSVILPFNAHQPESVRQACRTFGVICDTLAAASRVIDLMPGTERWVIQP